MANLTRRDMLQVVGGVAAGAAGTFVAVRCRQGHAAGSKRSAAANEAPQQSAARRQGRFPDHPERPGRRSHVREGLRLRQAVLTCCGRSFGLPEETGKRMASAFGGGMGMMGLTCGAVTGAFMAIGLKHAQTEAADNARGSGKPARSGVRPAVQAASRVDLLQRVAGVGHFYARGRTEGRVGRLFCASRCPVYVRDAAALLEHLLDKESREVEPQPSNAKETKT